MNELNLAQAKRLLKKADKYESAINSPGLTVSEIWGTLQFIQDLRSEVIKVSQFDYIPAGQIIANCTNNARKYIAVWLFELSGDITALSFIKNQLYSGNTNLIYQAVRALKAIRNEAARQILEAYCKELVVEENEQLFNISFEALGEFSYPEIPDHVREQLTGNTELALKTLKNIPNVEAANILLDYLHSKDMNYRRAAIDGLYGRKEEDLFRALIENLTAGSAQTKLDSLTLLCQYKSDTVCLAVCAIMKNGKSINLRKQAALALGDIGNSCAEKFLLSVLQDHNEHPDVIARVMISLKKFDSKEAIPLIHDIVMQESYGDGVIKLLTESNLYSLAVATLHSLCDKADTNIFIGLLQHRLFDVRMKSIHALRQRKSVESYRALQERLAQEERKSCIDELNRSIAMLKKFKPDSGG